jgi:hypothetical protein
MAIGGCGRCTGLGSHHASVSVKCRPWNEARSSLSSLTMTWTPSSSRSKRSFNGGKRIPRASDSSWFQPAPRPTIRRPPLITSMVAAILASTDGWRYGMALTWQPRRSRDVTTAIAASIDQPSKHGPERSEKIGSKWSKFHAD